MRTMLLPLCLISGTALAGVTMTFERTLGDKTAPSILKLEGKKVRVEFTSTINASTGFVIWDGEARTLTTARSNEKTFFRIDEASMKAQRELAKSKMEEMKAKQKTMLANMPPDQRARAEELLAKHLGPSETPEPTKYTPLNKSKKVGSWDCDLYEGKGMGRTSQVCMVPWKKSPVSLADLEELTAVNALGGAEAQGELADFKSLPGFPVESVSEGPAGKQVMVLKDVKKGSLDAKEFTVPADFTEKQLPGFGAAPRKK